MPTVHYLRKIADATDEHHGPVDFSKRSEPKRHRTELVPDDICHRFQHGEQSKTQVLRISILDERQHREEALRDDDHPNRPMNLEIV